jgi:hypothetical protein
MRFLKIVAIVLTVACNYLAADTMQPEEGFVTLFNGKNLDGWKVGDNAEVFSVRDGMIVAECPGTMRHYAHLFYVGEVSRHDFKNFDLRVDVMTFPKSNSGIYFHTKYQESGAPKFGLECQVNNSHSDWRRTGSLYGSRDISWGPETPPKGYRGNVTILLKPLVTDNVWYTQEVIYRDGSITIKLDGKTILEYKLPEADIEHQFPATRMTWLPRGTFALQGHSPVPGHVSKVYFKNIRVKVLLD